MVNVTLVKVGSLDSLLAKTGDLGPILAPKGGLRGPVLVAKSGQGKDHHNLLKVDPE